MIVQGLQPGAARGEWEETMQISPVILMCSPGGSRCLSPLSFFPHVANLCFSTLGFKKKGRKTDLLC